MAPLFTLPERQAALHQPCFIAPGAMVIGDVVLQPESSVWFNAVLRGDEARIEVGRRSNVQDGCVLHADPGIPLKIGEDVTVGHQCMLHGCEIGDSCLIGINSVILNHTRIGPECLIGANCLLPEGREVAARSLVLGSPGKVVRTLSAGEVAKMRAAAAHYVKEARRYMEHMRHDKRDTGATGAR